MKRLLCLLLFFFMPVICFAAEFEMDFVKTFGEENKYNSFSSVKVLEDGYIVVGNFECYDSGDTRNEDSDGYIVKFDLDGNIMWENSFKGNQKDYFTSVTVAQDGYVAVGYTESLDLGAGSTDYDTKPIIVKYDLNGHKLWHYVYNQNYYGDFSNSIVLSDNSYIAVGTIFPYEDFGHYDRGNSIVMKFDSDGNVIWEKYLREPIDGKYIDNRFYNIIRLNDDSFIVVGCIFNQGSYDGLIVKYDKAGNVIWEKIYGGKQLDCFDSVALSDNNSFVVVGYSNSFDLIGLESNLNDRLNGLLVKFDMDGNLLWNKFYNESFDVESSAYRSIVVGESGYYIRGYYFDENYKSIDFFYKCDFDGNPIAKLEGDAIVDASLNNFVSEFVVLEDDYFIGVGSVDFENDMFYYYYGLIFRGKLNYFIDKKDSNYGSYNIIKNGNNVVIKVLPDDGYDLDKIIIKDYLGKEVDLLKLEDGSYTFDLYSDVSVEVIFKDVLFNPKTGYINYNILLSCIFVISIFAYLYVVMFKKNLNF